MSQIDTEEILSETEAGHSGDEREMMDNLKLVPVAESIRYRKRAQSAEKKAEVLSEQLAQARSQLTKLSEQLSEVQTEQKLMRRLAAVGASDVETAMLIAKTRLNGETDADLEGVVEQLKKEKQYLFTQHGDSSAVKITKTAGARQRVANSQAVLERAAKKAATTGNRTDLQEYLKLRRNFL
jgi:glutamate mutase epsilon subunit